MNVLVACEQSGVVRDAFRALGHDAWSCDIVDTGHTYHLAGDALAWIVAPGARWDLLIAHPPCTYLAVSGLHWNKRRPGRAAKTQRALDFVRSLLDAPVPRIALENPVGSISTWIRKPDQYIQPWQFGHWESKKTGLWLKNLPLLVPTDIIPLPECGHWKNQTKSGQNKLPPSPDRAMLRSITYRGIASAMASQWSNL